MLEQQHINTLAAMVGEKGALFADDDLVPFVTEWREKFVGQTPLVLMPSSTQQVSDVLSYCASHRIAVVPQGGNTGLVGGGIPGLESSTEVLLSSRRLTSTIDVNPEAYTIVADAGVPVAALQHAASEEDRLFGLSLASEGSCTAGGIVSTNAGGVHVIRYGTARDMLLGVEAVLPDGKIVSDLSGLRKDNTGYTLSHLLAGAEGTLGFITKTCFRLFPKERATATAWLAVASPKDALRLLSLARDLCEDQVSVFEFMCHEALSFVYRHIPGCADPLSTKAPWYVLLETASSSSDSEVDERLHQLLERALALSLIVDGAVAQSLTQREQFWRIRESISEAQKLEGASIKHDISVPLHAIADFIDEATAALSKGYPGARITPFGHLGDGNLHFNVMQPVDDDKQAFLDNWEAMNRQVHDVVVRYGGSISAEHGIGVLKKAELARVTPRGELDAMRAIKSAFDPAGIMNPRCLLSRK